MTACAAAIGVAGVEPATAALPIPSDLVPGQKFQLAFSSSTSTNGESASIADYNQLVQAAANAAGVGSSLGITWKAIISTPTVNARDNAVVGTSTPVYNMNGQRLANGFADMWDGSLAAPLKYDESGAVNITDVWTGSGAGGTGVPGQTLGSPGGANGPIAWCGHPSLTTSQWINFITASQFSNFHVYALSMELTVPTSADFDLDGDVDGADFVVWQQDLGTTLTPADLTAWKLTFGSSSSAVTTAAAAAVPEPPASAHLLSAGCAAALAVVGRRLFRLRTGR